MAEFHTAGGYAFDSMVVIVQEYGGRLLCRRRCVACLIWRIMHMIMMFGKKKN